MPLPNKPAAQGQPLASEVTKVERDAKTATRLLFYPGPLQDLISLIPADERAGVLDRLTLLRTRAEYVESALSGTLAHGNGHVEPSKEPDRLLTPEEAADLLGLSVEQLRRRRDIPRKKIGHRTVHYPLSGLKRYMARGA